MVVMTAQPWEPRVSRLEGAIEQIGDRLADLHGDMTALRIEMNGLRDNMTTLRTDMRSELHDGIDKLRGEFRWMFATMIALVTALGAFLHFVH